ncbi:type II toxin-antitoxin system VapC family toxin [Gluconobacter cerevisiae]|uniref:Type II toxin-antitoxin system VapC family toxin n=1 Tax=Gluconobacter cerevisiae TaxID=1379734 RepID=A0ABR9YGY9_9PROT|nr:type II toxin-antitoxin system VapC family toxin [Gluconobacter cerevisiae]MBF0877929.1 type II toxin-antitoxin system VapC family toxin [Gluconobacter cerevisiae]
MTAFFDTSAVIALTDPNNHHHSWAMSAFTTQQNEGPIIINDVVYAEISAGMADQLSVDTIISTFGLQRAARDNAALFHAGRCFKTYRHQNKGPKNNVLSDFFIGAAACSLNVPLVTANPKDFRSYFHGLNIIHPSGKEITP